MISRNDPCWCGSGNKWKKCHYPTSAPLSEETIRSRYLKQYGILLKTPEQIVGIRRACQFAAGVLKELCAAAKEGVTTNEINDLSVSLHKKAGAIPASLGYGEPPFPKTICTSLNEEVCHGIPDDEPLRAGDILNIDIASIVGGFYGDNSAMVIIGETSPERKKVVEVSYECMMRAIARLRPGLPLWEIGQAIEDYAQSQGCSVVNQFVSHGVGLKYHEDPQIPHHYNRLQTPLAPGMTFTIEPMINAGRRECVIDPRNHWEARTIDGKASAQWEHTVLITDDGYEILTLL